MKKRKENFKFVYLLDKQIEKEVDKKSLDFYLKEKNFHQLNILGFSYKQKDFIRRRVQYLPPSEMLVINLLFWKNYSIKKAAQFLNCTTKTIEILKHRALTKLKCEYLEEFIKWGPSFNQSA